ncbi:MAG: acyltransferase [Calditrichota bacterium]
MNNSAGQITLPHPLYKKFRSAEKLFRWVRWFYSRADGYDTLTLLYYFFPQKILRINGRVPWPVHFTSRVLYHENIEVGYMVQFGKMQACYIQGRNGIIAGNNVRVGPGVGILSINHNISDYDVWDKANPIVIGDNVFIQMNTVILPGVQIGDNVLIQPNSVVNKDIPANSIVSGNPIRVVGQKEPYKGKDSARN